MDKANNKTAQTLVSVIVVVGFVFVLAMLILRPVAITDATLQLLLVLTGTLAAKFGDVVQYHIGSSAGSRSKDDSIQKLLESEAKAEAQARAEAEIAAAGRPPLT